jgi:hypothetical protein
MTDWESILNKIETPIFRGKDTQMSYGGNQIDPCSQTDQKV